MSEIDRHLASFAALVANALDGLEDGSLLKYYVAEVHFGHEGETVRGVRVAPDEFGGYSIHLGGEN